MTASVIIAGGMVSAAETSPYKDVKPSRWSYADIMYVSERGLMTGTSADKFAPAETMTRAMVVTVLYRLQGEPEIAYQSKFSDVKKDKWFTNAVIWAAENGIVEGKGNGIFAPMETITREQLAAIIKRYAPCEFIITDETTDITGYADYKRVHDYAREAMAWANAVGLITGKTETTLAPREGATREQFAAILKRFKEYDSYKYELVYNEPVYGQNYTAPEYPLVEDADIYVAVDGNDSNPGTIDKPVKTFAKAKDMVRELKKTATDGIVVAFKAGNYGSLDNLTFTAEDTGTAECPITYCAYGDGDVIFCNGIMISEDDFAPITDSEKALFPETSQDKVYKVDLNGKIDNITNKNMVFSSTGVCWEARYPDKNSNGTDNFFKDFTTRVEEEGKAEHEYDKIKLQGLLIKVVEGFSTVEGVKLTGFLRTGWLVDTFTAKSYNSTTKELTFDFTVPGSFDNGYALTSYPLAYEDRMDDTVFFSNLPEFMDNNGEYWFDTEKKILYIYAPEGDYTIGSGGTFITLEDEACHITFKGLEFNTTTDDAVFSKGDYITYDSCVFGNVGGNNALRTWSVNNFLAVNCEFYNFVCNGIRLDGDPDMDLLISDNNAVRNCYFHDFSLPQYWAHAIELSYCVDAVIEHCEFVNGAHAAIRFDNAVGTIIQYNVFDNMMMTTADYGAIYTFRDVVHRDNAIRYNLFTNIRAKEGQYSIYLDGSYGVEVYGNLFYNGGSHNIVFNDGRDNDVHDNININNNHPGDFLMYNAGPYDFLRDPEGKREDYEALVNNLGHKPSEGERGYEVWKERWPILYQYDMEVKPIDELDFYSFFSTINYVKRNKFIGTTDSFGEIYELFGVREGNEEFLLTDNPYFADPTHGDYTIVKGQEAFDSQHVFDFSMVGRK